jgi:hypothetical protein
VGTRSPLVGHLIRTTDFGVCHTCHLREWPSIESRLQVDEHVIDQPRMVLAALGAADDELRPGAEASEFHEIVPGVDRYSGLWAEDHQAPGQMPPRSFLS